MLKSLIAWDNLKFDEYRRNATNYIEKTTETGSFYSLPGIPLSDHFPIVNDEITLINQEEDDEAFQLSEHISTDLCEVKKIVKQNVDRPKFGFYESGKNSLRQRKSYHVYEDRSISLSNKNQTINNDLYSVCPSKQITYSRAANNLKIFLDKKNFSKNLKFSSLPLSFRTKGTEKYDKITQTISNELLNVETKSNCDKSNQTYKIVTKNTSVETEQSLKNVNFQKHISLINERINNQINNKEQLNIEIDNIVENSKLKKIKFLSPNKKSNIPNFQKKSLSEERICLKKPNAMKHVDNVPLFNSDNSFDKDSKLEEITFMSNSKLTSLNHSLEALDRHVKISSDANKNKSINTSDTASRKETTKIKSFWDNFPLKSELDKIRLYSHVQAEDKQPEKEDICDKVSGDFNDKSMNDSMISSQEIEFEFGDVRKMKLDELNSSQKKLMVQQKNMTVKEIIKTKSDHYSFNNMKILTSISSDSKLFRSFFLSPYDELVKSFLNTKDRRIKSISSKNSCSIVMEGPLNPQKHISTSFLSKTKAVFKCTVSSNNQENLDKCINYLKETFPNTYLQNGIKNLLK